VIYFCETIGTASRSHLPERAKQTSVFFGKASPASSISAVVDLSVGDRLDRSRSDDEFGGKARPVASYPISIHRNTHKNKPGILLCGE
jgi:hypothetical protein